MRSGMKGYTSACVCACKTIVTTPMTVTWPWFQVPPSGARPRR